MLVLGARGGAGGDEMSDDVEQPRPPKRVVVVVVLTYISGVLDILAGILIIMLRYDRTVEESGDAYPITLWGAAMILIGLLTIAMASGLTRGRNSARIYVSVLVALSALVSVIDVIAAPTDASAWVSLAIGGGIAALIILALWVGRSAEFFRRSQKPRAA
jgi:drug/metabolite transporter (DMT)-like permease